MLVRGQNLILNEISIEKLVYGGEGLARIDGQVVLTPFVLPGETVRIETETESKGVLRGKPMEILTASDERVKPPCQYFTRCGGCHYQHAPYERQLHYKRVILREVLRRVGKMTVDDIDVESAEPLGYRNRVQLHVADSRLGFHQAGTHELQPVLECLIAAPLINDALGELRKMAHQPRFPKFVRSIELFTNGEEVQLNVLESGGKRLARGFFEWCAKQIPGADTPALNYQSGEDTFRVGHRSFFQVNRFLVERLTAVALDGAEGNTALDLYAGVGLLTLPLSRRFANVTAVESGRGASDDLKYNAEAAGATVNVQRNTAELFLEEYQGAPDFILADPPRAGLGKSVVKQLLRIRAPRLTIVSCDPSTLARDLASLIDGGYELQKMTLVDLFPETYHIETVTTLTLPNQGV